MTVAIPSRQCLCRCKIVVVPRLLSLAFYTQRLEDNHHSLITLRHPEQDRRIAEH